MSEFTIQRFKSQVFSAGLARENRFEVILPEVGPGSGLMTLMCKSASLPNLVVLTKQQKLFGPPAIRGGSVDYGGQGVQMSFLLDSKMNVKKYFDDWIHKVVNPGSFTVNYSKDYSYPVYIYQLNEKEERTYEIKLTDAFPTSVGPLNLDQGSNDSFHVLPVTLAYRYWESQDISQTVTQTTTRGFSGVTEVKPFPKTPTLSSRFSEGSQRNPSPARE